jgi:hypothetical protein
MNKCFCCDSENIIKNVLISEAGGFNEVGPTFKDGIFARYSIPMYADICKDCGSVLRFHVDPKMLTAKLVIKSKE